MSSIGVHFLIVHCGGGPFWCYGLINCSSHLCTVDPLSASSFEWESLGYAEEVLALNTTTRVYVHKVFICEDKILLDCVKT